MRKVTGNEDYEFGDLTNAALGAAETALSDYFSDATQKLLGDLTAAQRKEVLRSALIGIGAQIGAVLVVSFAFVAKLLRAATVVLAWAVASAASRQSPLAAGQWASFVTTHGTIRMVAEPLLIPLHVLAAVFLTPSLRSLVISLQRRLPMEDRAWLNVSLALVVVFSGGTAVAASVAGVGIWLAGLVIGVPVFP